ncbi:MAG: 3-dehydroquinate synthase [Succinivibrio sp.]|nr:3-dehydroquinate synthase [Succinivibrio sp.]
METLSVSLKERSYPIQIGAGLDYGSLLCKVLQKLKDVMVVTNETIAPLYLDAVTKSLEQAGFLVRSCILRDGERYKTVDSFMQIHTALLEAGYGRDCALVALGGGVVGDMTGFAASTYQRGVPYVQLPTTLLAMVDSSVGGKTAINHPLGKNMIGTFYQPKAVLCDIEVLKTLPEREIAAGMAEVIKYGIMESRDFFAYLKEQADKVFAFESQTLITVVRSCCESKARVVNEDEQEHGRRALLNLGHTFGHAVEAFLGFGTWLHGEAVSLGMVIAAALARKRGYLSAQDEQDIIELLTRCHLPVLIPEGMQAEDFLKLMRHDKKVRSGVIRYVLPTRLGDSAVFADVTDAEVAEVIASCASRGHAAVKRGQN